MNGTAQAGMAVLALVYVAAWLLVRYAVTGGQPRPRKPRPVAVYVPAFHLIPAQQYACPGCGLAIDTNTGER